jgi:hypothetical protein
MSMTPLVADLATTTVVLATVALIWFVVARITPVAPKALPTVLICVSIVIGGLVPVLQAIRGATPAPTAVSAPSGT